MPRYKSSKKSHAGDVLSTKEAAVICKVALSTIVYWFDKGLIRGYRTPGGHRRIFRSDLEKFMKDHRMPLGHRLVDGQVRVLVAAADPSILRSCSSALEHWNGRVELAEARSGFEAGRLLGAFKPDVLCLELQLPGVDAASVCAGLREDPETKDVEILALGSAGDAPGIDALAAVGACELVPLPCDADQLRSLLSRRLG